MKINSVVIVGGCSSGWMSASVFAKCFKGDINVTLIGKIISEKGIHFDSHLEMKNIKKFDHFC